MKNHLGVNTCVTNTKKKKIKSNPNLPYTKYVFVTEYQCYCLSQNAHHFFFLRHFYKSYLNVLI